MNIGNILGKTISLVTSQLTSDCSSHKTIHFTNNFYEKAKEWNLGRKDAEDVYYHGMEVKHQLMIRQYYGYEIGIYYFKDKKTGSPVISSIWKRSTY